MISGVNPFSGGAQGLFDDNIDRFPAKGGIWPNIAERKSMHARPGKGDAGKIRRPD